MGFEHSLFGPEVVRGPKGPNSMCIVLSGDGFSQESATSFRGIPYEKLQSYREMNHQLSINHVDHVHSPEMLLLEGVSAYQ